MNLINGTYQLCVLSHFTWMVVPIMNLISETYQLYEMRKYAFIIFREYAIISLFVVHNYLRYIIEYFSRVKAIKLGLLYMKMPCDKSCWLIYFKSLVMWHDFYLVSWYKLRIYIYIYICFLGIKYEYIKQEKEDICLDSLE